MISIQFNASAVFDQLAHARDKLDDLTPVHQDISDYMVKATRDRFKTSTAPDGTPWRRKSKVTLQTYLRRGDGNRPDPLIGPSGRLGREVAGLATRDSAEIGSSLEYSAVMQHGAKKGAFGPRTPWGDIPARVFLGISDEDERNILDIVDEYLENVVGGDAPA